MQRGGRYVNEFRTFPDPKQPLDAPVTFIVLGDYGTGIRRSTPKRRQREVALAMQAVFDRHDVRFVITAGDNIYAGMRILGLPLGTSTGDEDDEWFFTFFQPYRYLYLRERFAADAQSGRASLDPGLFYRFHYGRDLEFVCLDTSKEHFFRGKRLFEYPKHREWLERAMASDERTRWRVACCHHPPYCAGPKHGNTAWIS
ncbi:MAG: hypothetical protein ACRD3G_15835 [Vicinamibacterales bacterium]